MRSATLNKRTRQITPLPKKESPALRTVNPPVPIQNHGSPEPLRMIASPTTATPAPTRTSPVMQNRSHRVRRFTVTAPLGSRGNR